MMRRLLLASLGLAMLVLLSLALWLYFERDWHPLIALSCIAVVPLIFVGLLLLEQFAIGAWLRRRTRPDLHFGWPDSVRAWAGELPVTLRTFFYAQLRYAERRLPSAERPERIPVLLVHGYLCNRGIWWPFSKMLARRGHPVDSVNLEPIFGSIDDYAPIIAAGVERLRTSTGTARVAIVAHSMGGLAARAYLARYGHDAVAAVVTLGSPHHGTWLARFGHGLNVAQMHPDSAWLRALEQRESLAVRALFTTIYTHHDNVVMPQAAQTLDGARAVAFNALGHVQLVYDPEVWAQVVQALDAVAPRSSPSGDTAAARRTAGEPAEDRQGGDAIGR